jgi:hypothetical protein
MADALELLTTRRSFKAVELVGPAPSEAEIDTLLTVASRVPDHGKDALDALERQFDEDERAQFRGEPPRRQQIVSDDPTIPASYRAKDAIGFYLQPLPQGVWTNDVTLRSGRLSRMYDPGNWVARVSPTPLLMIVALADRITRTDLQLRAYQQALDPKKLVTIEGGHFDPYVGQFDRASAAAVSWFAQHLNADVPGEAVDAGI